LKYTKIDILKMQLFFVFYCFKSIKNFNQLLNFLCFKFLCLFRNSFYKIQSSPDDKINKIFFSKNFFLNFKFDRRFIYFYTIKNKLEQIKLVISFFKKKEVPCFEKKELIEVGAGFGMNLFFLEKIKFKRLFGLDINRDYVNFGNNFYRKKKIYLKQSDVVINNFNNPIKTFDYLLCMNFLAFVDPKKLDFFLQKIKRNAKKIIILENSFHRLSNKKKSFYDKLLEHGFIKYHKKIYYHDKITALFYYNF